MKKLISGIVFCLIVASGALYYFVFSNNEPIKVTSDDKQFTLNISPDSLPEGILSDDLSIEKLEEEDLSEFEQALEPFAVYRLGPDGTEFSEPLTFELTVDTQGSEFAPNLLHLAGNSVETVSDVQVSKNEDGTFTLQGTLDHFSDIVITYGFFGSEMPDDLDTHLVGESFTVTVTLKKRDVDWVSKGLEAVLEGDPEFIVPGTFFATMILSPEEITNQPAEGSTFDSTTMSFEGTFTCLEVGNAEIFYHAKLFYDYNFYREGIAGLSDIFNYIFPAFLYDSTTLIEKATVTCVEPAVKDVEEEETPRKPADPEEPEDPVIYIDPTPDEPDPVADEAAICTVPEDDTCSNPAQYGFPVCDEANLPIECKATDSRPGWDCYTFEDASCEPSTRCFCITPPEDL